jgi:hypothetical protein
MADRRFTATTASTISPRPRRGPAPGGIELAYWLLLSALFAVVAIAVLALAAAPSS